VSIEQRRRPIVVLPIDPQLVSRPFGQVHLEVPAEAAGARHDVGGDAFNFERVEHCFGQPGIEVGQRNVMAGDEPVVTAWHLHQPRTTATRRRPAGGQDWSAARRSRAADT